MMRSKAKLVKLAVVTVVCVFAFIACKSTQQNLNQPAPQPPAPAPPPQQTGFVKEADFIEPGSKSTYDHFRDGHIQLTNCADCHARDTRNPAAPVSLQPGREYWQPYHDACTRCHKVEKEKYNLTEAGATKNNPFCAACHQDPPVVVTGNQTFQAKLLDYPKRNDDFGIMGGLKGFSHQTHMDPAKMGNDTNVSCALCHDVRSSATRATFPKHQQCFQCHTHQAGQQLSNCGVCHVRAAEAVKYSPGMTSALNYNFKHSKSHLSAASCDRCHRLLEPVEAARVDVQQINTGRGQRHKSSCWTCHTQKREAVCSKCHVNAIPF